MSRETKQKVIKSKKNLYPGVTLTLAAAVMLSLFLISGARAESKIYYVTVNGGATLRDGSSWESALPAASLDYALTECSINPDKREVRAAKGLYTRKATLTLPKGVKLTGGWDTKTNSRDITKMMANPMSSDRATILSRDASVANMSIITGTNGAATDDTILDGFTITGGTGTQISGGNRFGGGLYNPNNANPTIINCTISGNTADVGGGIYNASSHPAVANCVISGNRADEGGGIYNFGGSNPAVTNCTITGNTADVSGGGICNYNGGNPTVTNCTISGNSSAKGGGLYSEENSSPVIANTILWGNTSGSGNDDIYVMSGTATVRNCVVGESTGSYTSSDVIRTDPRLISVDKNMTPTANSKDVYIYIISGDSSALGEGLPVGTAGNGIKVPSTDQLGRPRRTNYADIGVYQHTLNETQEIYTFAISKTSADLEIGQSVSFEVTVKPINNAVLTAENPYADVSVKGKTITLTAKAGTNGEKTIAIKATYGGTGGHILSADFTLTVKESYSGSGGCGTGLSSLSLLAMALLPFAAKKRKK